MKDFLSDLANEIVPYVAGEQLQLKNMIKLNTNENPFPPSPKAIKAMANFDAKKLRLYPNTSSFELRKAIAKMKEVEPENVFVGNGSDEVLALCYKAFFNPNGDEIVFADITYSFYPVFADSNKICYRTIPLNKDLSINVKDYLNLPDYCQGVIIANPNAPTAMKIAELGDLEMIIKANSERVVIIDEAYVDFSKESAISLTKLYKNLVVVQTFSKSYSLAGARCGFAIADKYLIEGLERIKDSFNSYPVDMLTQEICKNAILDKEYFDCCVDEIVQTRDWFCAEIKKLGFNFPKSDANFVFATHPKISGKDVYSKLKDVGVLVRFFDKPKIDNYVRITIGLKKDMQKVVKLLKKIILENAEQKK